MVFNSHLWLVRLAQCLLLIVFHVTDAASTITPGRSARRVPKMPVRDDAPSILILGGGMTGAIAARTLHQRGHDNFIIVEAHNELGGRMQTEITVDRFTVEQGPNWVQGTQTSDGPANPVYLLAKKFNLTTQPNDLYGSLSFYDFWGPNNFSDTFNRANDVFTNFTVAAGSRLQESLIDLNGRAGYSLVGSKPSTHVAQASEYYLFDFEFAQTPERSSWIAASLNNNFTYVPESGGFSEDNLLCVDQRGFKTIVQAEAAEFLKPEQVLFNATVKTVKYSSGSGVEVVLASGAKLTADYALVTFSVGVLQNDDVTFEPNLPAWKQEAIQSITMATYTKIFLQFPENFWFDTQMALYADKQRGRYTVWQNLDLPGFLPGSKIIFVTVTDDFSKRIEALTNEEVQNEVLAVLALMFPNATIPAPTAFFFPRWHSNPLFRGSYSNMPASYVTAHQENLRATVEQRLWFAGEASSVEYFGFLQGAYFEGLDVGNSLADCIEAGGCSGLAHIDKIKQGGQAY